MNKIFGSKSKTKTQQTQTQTGTMTPTNPGWVDDAVRGMTNQAMALGQTDPYQYVAGPSDLQNQAFAGASNLGGWQGANQAGQALTLMGALGGPNLAGQRSSQASNPLYGAAITQGGQPSPGPGGARDGNIAIQQEYEAAQRSGTPEAMSLFTARHPGFTPPAPTNAGGNVYQNNQGAYTYQAPQVGQINLGPASQASAAQLGAAPQGTAVNSTAAQLGNAPQGQATSFTAPQIGQVSGYNAPQADINAILAGLGSAPGVSAGSAQAGIANAGQIGPTSTAAAQYANQIDPSALIERYMSPYRGQVYDTTMADYDAYTASRMRELEAQAAHNGAFGGSGYYLQQGQQEADNARGRAATGANVLNTGFTTSLNAALQDAGLRSQIEGLNAQLGTGVSQFNAGERNNNARTQAGLDTQTSISNAGNQTQASVANAGNQTQASIAAGGYARDYGLAGLDARTRTALANAGLSADSLRFLSQAQNDRTMQQGQFDYGAASQNAASQNQFGLANMDMAGRYGLQQGAFDQQTGLANQDASMQAMLANLGLLGQYGLQQGQFNQQANLANAGWQNDRTLAQGQLDQTGNLANAGFQQSAGQFGASANNALDMFNAQQRDIFLSRLLAGGGQLGQLGSDFGAQQRGDVGLQGQLGSEQRDIEQAYRTAPLSLLQAQNALTPWSSFGLFQGQNTSGTSNMTGTNVQTSSASPFNIGLSLASLFKPSDPAFKTDISPAGRENGFNLYNYRYKWDEPSRPLRTGVMADEVEDVRPDAVSVVNGFRMVDYGALGLAHLVEA